MYTVIIWPGLKVRSAKHPNPAPGIVDVFTDKMFSLPSEYLFDPTFSLLFAYNVHFSKYLLGKGQQAKLKEAYKDHNFIYQPRLPKQ